MFVRHSAAAFALVMSAAAQPAMAQDDYAVNVAFFQRAAIGAVDVTPVAVFVDTRCADIRFCERDNEFLISAILHDGFYNRELILAIDTPVAVPGGYLVLRDAGTKPALYGAIPAGEYRLAFEYLSLR